jgi:hypothetical protein
MSYAKTWTFSWNTSPTDQTNLTNQCQSFIWQLYDFLTTSAGWTVEDSNSWSSRAGLTWAASGAHSWVSLKSPAGIVAGLDGSYTGDQSRIWLTIDLLSANAYQATFRFHRVAPTGGSGTAAPTSTNQLSWATQQFARSSFVGNAVFHFECTAEGNFLAQMGYSGAGRVPFALCSFPFGAVNHNAGTGKDYPFAAACYARFLDSGNGPLTNAWDGSGLFYHGGTNSGAVLSWCADGSAGQGYLATVSGQGATAVPSMAGSSFGISGDAFSGDWPSYPCEMHITTSGKACYVGTLADIEATGATLAQGKLNDAGTHAFVGGLFLPSGVEVTL